MGHDNGHKDGGKDKGAKTAAPAAAAPAAAAAAPAAAAADGPQAALTLKYRGNSVSIGWAADTTVRQLKERVKSVVKKSIHRVSLVVEPAEGAESIKLRDDDKTVASYGVKGGMKLVFKDLGPQIGYRTVFIIEYLGPIIIMLLYAMRPSILYGAPAALAEWNWVATWGVAAWILHFVKRELETLFVHKFSLPTMPLSNLFKNSAYYWGFALAVGYPLCHPDYTAPDSLLQVQVGAALMACAELANLLVHLQLSGMRKVEGSKERAVPGGPLFALVSCPNYTAEILSWVGFSIMTQIAFSYAFTVVGFLQMSEWALKKHRNYITSSNGEYKKLGRKAIVPFLL